jgi:hypothetical protein
VRGRVFDRIGGISIAVTRTKTLDFIVIGSGRSGTTSLWKHLDSHPEIHTPPDKEQAFFSIDRNYARGLEWYMRKILGSADSEAKCGTVTPAYMAGSEEAIRMVASRIKESAPDARLIALLRDPIDRAVAIYRSWARNPAGKKVPTFEETVLPTLRLEAQRDIITGAEYGRILNIYLEFFPREQIMVAFTADLQTRPEELMAELFEFIGVDPSHVPPDLTTRYREGGMKMRVPGEAVDSLIEHMKTEVWPHIEDPGREKERGFNWWLRYIWNIEPDDEGKEVEESTRELLKARFAPDIEVLREDIGVEPPWAEAYGAGSRQVAKQAAAPPPSENGRPDAAVAETEAAAVPGPDDESPAETRPARRGTLPTFLIIGAQKSGTRWLRRNLGEHPEIFTADRECAYFSDDPRFGRGLKWYRKQFRGWDGEEIVGEATPGYMMWKPRSPSVEEMATRMDEQLEGVKLIAILRNPVDRLYSAFIHHMLHDRVAHDADLLEVVAAKPPKESGLRLVMGSMYGESLRPFAERFGDRLQILLQEDAKEDAEALYRTALEHIGADPDFVSPDLNKVVHSYKPPPDSPYAQEDGRRRPLTAEEREELFGYFTDDVAELEGLIGRDLSLWRP